jgi:hypothetical protein
MNRQVAPRKTSVPSEATVTSPRVAAAADYDERGKKNQGDHERRLMKAKQRRNTNETRHSRLPAFRGGFIEQKKELLYTRIRCVGRRLASFAGRGHLQTPEGQIHTESLTSISGFLQASRASPKFYIAAQQTENALLSYRVE